MANGTHPQSELTVYETQEDGSQWALAWDEIVPVHIIEPNGSAEIDAGPTGSFSPVARGRESFGSDG